MNHFQHTLLLVMIATISVATHGQNFSYSDSTRVYSLGEVSVISSLKENTIGDSLSLLLNHRYVSEAVGFAPGVTLSSFGSRNEQTIYVRGFDLRDVPVYIDGIPVYIPFDGYIDLRRLASHDYSRIAVSAGFTPIGFGANTLGGAINLVGKKPAEKLEAEAWAGAGSGRALRSGIRIGSMLKKVYLSGNISQSSRSFYPLSAAFDTTGITGTESGGRRDNSYHSDFSASLKAGYMPNATDEYSLNVQYHHAEKGTPPYAGRDNEVFERFWRWPYWNKQGIYFIGKKRIGRETFLTARTFYDAFQNQLSSYDDNSYTTQTFGYAFDSFYDDYSLGGNLEVSSGAIRKHLFKAALLLKDDHHKEYNEGEPARRFHDRTISLGAEDAISLAKNLKWTNSIEIAGRAGIHADDYNSADSTISSFPASGATALNLQTLLHFRPSEKLTLHAFVARKTRFATMKERYAYRPGRNLPNPDLKAQKANHFEIGGTASPAASLELAWSVFYIRLKDALVGVDNVQPGVSQIRNFGRTRHAGASASADLKVHQLLTLHANYTYLDLANLSDPDTRLVNVPRHDFAAYAIIRPFAQMNMVLNTRYMSERFSTSYGTVAESFFVMNSSLNFNLFRYISLEVGIENLLDTHYGFQEGYPEPGRTFYFTTRFNL